jgi:hypothetical protein
MKARIFLAAVAVATVLSPTHAHAGAAQGSCAAGGTLLLESTDSSLLQFAHLWDFEVRSVKANGVDVSFGLSSGTNAFEQYSITQAVPAGQTVTFEFRQVRNLVEGGDGFASAWTMHTFDAPSCSASSVVTVVPTSLGAPTTTTAGSGVVVGNPTTTAGSGTSGNAPLPRAGSDSSLLLGTAAGLLAAGSLIVVASRRRAT